MTDGSQTSTYMLKFWVELNAFRIAELAGGPKDREEGDWKTGKCTIDWLCPVSYSGILRVLGACGHDESRRQLDEFIKVTHIGYKTFSKFCNRKIRENLTVHRISYPSEEAVDVRVFCVMDCDVGMAILCENKRLRWSVLSLASLFQVHEPRISPRATFSGLILQASSYRKL
jgi:hypothetical protein